MSELAPSHPTEAVDAWHAALERGDRGAECAAWLDDQLRARGLYFGDRPLCTVLRPRFLTPGQYDLLSRGGAVLLRALGKVFEAAMARPDVLGQFGLEPWESELLRADRSAGAPNPLSRIDAFFDAGGGGFKITELNGETPAGPAYADALSEIFLGMPVARDFLREWRLGPLPVRHRVLHTLLAAWERFAGTQRLPAIAIVDWTEVPTRSEFLLFEEYFRRLGLSCVIADPAELEVRGNRLYAGDLAIDVVYKRVLLHELVKRRGLDDALIRAVRDGAVCMVNGFRCKLLHKKAGIAVLSDEQNANWFDGEERRAIAAHIPWTRVVTERRTSHAGRAVDLVPFILAERERMVLKPNDEYGGAGVVLGWEVDPAQWEAAVQHALATPTVVQQRIHLPSIPFPGYAEGTLRYADLIADTAPFAFEGALIDGCLTRASADSLVNVTAGGGSTMATFLVEPRSA